MRKPVLRVYDQVLAIQPLTMARNSKIKKKMDCTICVAKTKALNSCAVTAQLIRAVTAQLICAFVFAYAKKGFLMTWLDYIICL